MTPEYARRNFTCKSCETLHCVWCGGDVKFGDANAPDHATREHMLAKILGGSDKLENLEVACRKCNNFRGHRTWRTYHRHAGDITKMTPHQRLHYQPSTGISKFRMVDLGQAKLAVDPIFNTQAAYGLKNCKYCGLGYDSFAVVQENMCKHCYTWFREGKKELRVTAPKVICPRCSREVPAVRKISGVCRTCHNGEWSAATLGRSFRCYQCDRKRETSVVGKCKKCHTYQPEHLPLGKVVNFFEELKAEVVSFIRANPNTTSELLDFVVLATIFRLYKKLFPEEDALALSVSAYYTEPELERSREELMLLTQRTLKAFDEIGYPPNFDDVKKSLLAEITAPSPRRSLRALDQGQARP